MLYVVLAMALIPVNLVFFMFYIWSKGRRYPFLLMDWEPNHMITLDLGAVIYYTILKGSIRTTKQTHPASL
jgi:hypothetical protein